MAALTPEQYNAMGNEALSLQDFQMAIKYYGMGLSHDVDQELHPVILSNRSPAYAHTGQWALALQDADTCVALRPTWPRGYACRGAALEGMGKTLEALEAFKHAQKLSASNPELAEIVSDLERSLGITNNFQGTHMINAPLSVSLMHQDTSDKIAGVGMHIMLDMVHGGQQKRIKVNSIADWSPLIGHAQPGDTLEEIDNIPCYTMTFEHVLPNIPFAKA